MFSIQNLYTALKSPDLAIEFARYQFQKTWHGDAVLTLWSSVKVSGFSGFSEYHTVRSAVSESEYNFFQSLDLQEGDLVDVGANLGVVSGLMGHLWPDRTVHSFEPGPSTFQSLQTTIQLNDLSNVRPNNLALSDRDGKLVFDPSPHSRATAKLAEQTSDDPVEAGNQFIHVPSTTLDNYIEKSEASRISLLKLDVEGYEPLVLDGSSTLLTEKRIDIIYFEVCPQLLERAGFATTRTCTQLQNHGYMLHRLQSGHLFPAQPEDMKEVDLENWVAVSPRLSVNGILRTS